MNVFEDLIVELKEENLLEHTVMDPPPAEAVEDEHLDADQLGSLDHSLAEIGDEPLPDENVNSGEDLDPQKPDFEIQGSDENLDWRKDPEPTEMPGMDVVVDDVADTDDAELLTSQYDIEATAAESSVEPAIVQPAVLPDQDKAIKRGSEFFKKRAIAEVSGLQMVDHVLSSVEREYLKIVPRTYDDLVAKKALNGFLKALEDADEGLHAAAEYELMQETEAWCSALAERDAQVPVGSLRQYCEKTRPALSSQAMLSLAKFYRNSPYSEAVRAKFDFVMTRLFSRAKEKDERVCLFGRPEMLSHVNTLYSDWASVPLYTADDDENHVMLTALSFEDLALEAENARLFDQLISSDFFGRVRLFKESINEIFFAPEVVAAAIDANVRIGNAYVALIASEREKLDAASIESKYAAIDEAGVSDATAQTLHLVELLRNPEPTPDPEPAAPKPVTHAPDTKPQHKAAKPKANARESAPEPRRSKEAKAEEAAGTTSTNWFVKSVRGVNKWVLVFAAVMLLISAGIWLWAGYADEQISTVGVVAVDFNRSSFAEFIKTAKSSNGTVYAQLQPTWDSLPKEKRQEILQKIYQEGVEKNYSQVTLISKDGKMVGFASPSRLDIITP